jgi:exodeoxyribonuclease VII small subunit
MAKRDEELTFEACLARLEEIVGSLEKGDARLEEGLSLFEEGVQLTRACHEKLAAAEERVRKLVREEDGDLRLTLFPEEDEAGR